jgi:IS30 family transposase
VLYKQLSYEERVQIAILLKEKYSIRQIAKVINRNPGTISREIKRNFWDAFRAEYNASCADRKYRQRQRIPRQPEKMKNEEIKEYAENHLKMGWSPEQISGRMPIDKPGLNVSYETIYKYAYKAGKTWVRLLPQKKPKRQKRGDLNQSRKINIPDRVSIDERPAIINKREEIGHWESDSMISRQSSSALNVLVERKNGYLLISKIRNITPSETKAKIVNRLCNLPKSIVKSITYDNGFENRDHAAINIELNTKSYFCHPYHSWEKGTVENTNGLIRRYLPKKTDFDKIDASLILSIEHLINNRPRKRLKFKTPFEVLSNSVALHT